MKPDKLTNEFLTSADWDDIVGWQGGFTLGVGYCYVNQLSEYFKKQNINYHFFDVKWGRCGTTYLFSALKPNNIIVFTAWKNSGIICGTTETLFRIWQSILLNLASINVDMVIFDTPAAWHRSNLVLDNGQEYARQMIQSRGELYHKTVIEPCLAIHDKISYYDLSAVIDEKSILIHENFSNTAKVPSPWHLTSRTLESICQYYIDTILLKQSCDLNERIEAVEQEERLRYEKTYPSTI